MTAACPTFLLLCFCSAALRMKNYRFPEYFIVTTLFAQTPVDFKRLGSEYVLCENGGLLSNDPDSTDKGVLISNPADP